MNLTDIMLGYGTNGEILAVFHKPKKYQNPKKKTRIQKKVKRLMMKNNESCSYCGVKLEYWNGDPKPNTATLDHIIPKSKGGKKSIFSTNIALACYRCNIRKGSQNIEEFKKSLASPNTSEEKAV